MRMRNAFIGYRSDTKIGLYCIYEEAVRNSRRTPFALIRKTSVLLMFMEILAGYWELYRPQMQCVDKMPGFYML
jgi:hypothetical protein